MVPGEARVPRLSSLPFHSLPEPAGISFRFRPSFLQDPGSSFLQSACHVFQMLQSLIKGQQQPLTPGLSVDRVLMRGTASPASVLLGAGAGLVRGSRSPSLFPH